MAKTYRMGLLSLMSDGTATLRDCCDAGDVSQYVEEFVFADVLLLAVMDERCGEPDNCGDADELSLIAFSFACRLHLYR